MLSRLTDCRTLNFRTFHGYPGYDAHETQMTFDISAGIPAFHGSGLLIPFCFTLVRLARSTYQDRA